MCKSEKQLETELQEIKSNQALNKTGVKDEKEQKVVCEEMGIRSVG